MIRSILLSAFLLPSLVLAMTAREIADSYSRYAVDHNSYLRAQRREIDLARTERRSALGAFMPVVDLNSRHSWADGGRDIEFDVNEFLPSEVLPVDLPPTVIPFLRTKEQETKLQVTQPLFTGGGLFYSYRATRQAEQASVAGYETAMAELTLRVRQTYYQYLQARELLDIEQHQYKLAEEQLRVTRALYEVGKLAVSELRRAEAGLFAAEARRISAETQMTTTKQAVNLLLGRDLTDDIMLPGENSDSLEVTLSDVDPLSLRPEMTQLNYSINTLKEQKRAVRSGYLPMISAAFEYGYQGEKYDFNEDADYYMLSGVLSWNLFEGFRTNLKRQKVELARRQLEDRRDFLEKEIQRQVDTAALTLKSKQAEQKAASQAKLAAAESHRLAEIRYREGMSSQLELTDARTALASASAQEVLARYGCLIALASYEHSLGLSLKDIEQ
ncbi:TolC family protein [bacterium]|nr:TolC family protein [bacterium]MBU1919787.1 TolC family protein [bacterium]